MTAEDMAQLKAELEFLKVEGRKKVREDLAVARSFGDLSENAEYDEAKRSHSTLEGKIADLERMLQRVEVVTEIDHSKVAAGALVVVMDLKDHEEMLFSVQSSANMSSDLDAIPVTPESPIGKGLMAKTIHDEVEIETPMGTHKYKIVSISYPGRGGAKGKNGDTDEDMLVDLE